MSGSKSTNDRWIKSTLGIDVDAAGRWLKGEAHDAAKAIGDFDDSHGQVLTRAAGVAQAVGGGLEAMSGAAIVTGGGAATATGVGAAPGIPAMVGGGLLAANGVDNLQAGLRTAWSGKQTHTLGADAAGAAARGLGASNDTADKITNGMDLAQGVAGGAVTAGTGLARRATARGLEESAKLAQAARLAEAAKAAEAAKLAEAAKAAEAAKVAEEAKAAKALDTPPPKVEAPPADPLKPSMPQDLPPLDRAKLPTPDNAGGQEIADKLAKLKDLPPTDPARAALVEDYARASTHMQPPPDRVVLGTWTKPGEGGYIDKAKEAGGVWYETPKDSFGKVGGAVAWESNVAFLRQQMASGIKQIAFEGVKIDEIIKDGEETAAKIAMGVPNVTQRARYKEVLMLLNEGPEYGFKRVGNAFVKVD